MHTTIYKFTRRTTIENEDILNMSIYGGSILELVFKYNSLYLLKYIVEKNGKGTVVNHPSFNTSVLNNNITKPMKSYDKSLVNSI